MAAVLGRGSPDRPLSDQEVQDLTAVALQEADLRGARVLVLIPDGTRTAPIPLFFRLFHACLAGRVRALDFLVALGTHPPLSDEALARLVGLSPGERSGALRDVRLFNHRWDLPEALAVMGALSREETHALSQGLMDEEVPVAVNRLLLEYDQVLICGPVFPHEVVGFSGGHKYLFPGVAGQAIIDATHWLGALLTNLAINGVVDTPVRAMLDRAASFLSVPILCFSLVMRGEDLVGLYIGPPRESQRAAALLSAQVNVIYLDRAYRQVLAVAPPLYEDLWTAAKAMYKTEPIVADGGEVILYAPHITEVSYTHGALLDQIGYHTRDYYLAQMDRFAHIPRCVLAHSTHLKGQGTFANGVEQPRIRVTLATGIPEERCRRLNLGYRDPATVDLAAWESREDEGLLLVRKAGETLYRLRGPQG
ncbi:MAG: lactate racemase domain-containing protein [Anaerolineae bacterium]